MRLGFRGYLVCGCVCAVMFAVILGTVNVVVDPHAAFGEPFFQGLHRYRRLGSRTAKAAALRRAEFEVLVLGSSRSEAGIDTGSAALSGRPTWNASLPGTSLHELEYVWEFAVESKRPELAILFVDLHLFQSASKVSQDFHESLFDPALRGHGHEYFVRQALSGWATRSTVKVLFNWVLGRESEYTPTVRRVTVGVGRQRHRFQAQLTRTVLMSSLLVENGGAGRGSFDILDRIVTSSQARGIRLVLVIPPLHALQLEAVRLMGRWSDFELWKSELVQHLDGSEVPVWDFTGYTGVSAEAVPAEGSPESMQWFIDASHCSPALGDRVLARVLETSVDVDPSFGVLLTRGNVEEHRRRIRLDRERWAESHGEDLRWIEGLYDSLRTP